MRKAAAALCLLMCLSGCGVNRGNAAEQLALEIRSEYVDMSGCTAQLDITADYGQRVYQYGVSMTYQKDGEITLELTAPDNVAGVTARLADGETALEYDGTRVETGVLSEDGLSPIDAVPLLLSTVQEGFLAECVLEELDGTQVLHLFSRDPYKSTGQGTEVQLWFDTDTHALRQGEISQDGFTVIRCVITGLQFTA